MTDREAFEAWARAVMKLTLMERAGDTYMGAAAEWSWLAWQAALSHARASGEAEPVAYLIEEPNGDKDLSFDDLMPADREAGYSSRPLVHPAPAQEPATPDLDAIMNSALNEMCRSGRVAIVTDAEMRVPAQEPVAVPAGESDGDLLGRLRDDAALWAAEFRATALRLGYSDMDEGWLIGWFANAIENTEITRRGRWAAPVSPPAESGEVEDGPLSFFISNVDRWGAAEWFDRLVKAVRAQDKAAADGEDISVQTYRNIAASSAVTLVREHEAHVRAGLASTPTPPQAQDFAKGAEADANKLLEKAVGALDYFADAVFNDNGDMTVTGMPFDPEKHILAYQVRRRILAVLPLPTPAGED